MTQAVLHFYHTFSELNRKRLQAKLKTCEKNPESEYWPMKSLCDLVVVGRLLLLLEHGDGDVSYESISQELHYSA